MSQMEREIVLVAIGMLVGAASTWTLVGCYLLWSLARRNQSMLDTSVADVSYSQKDGTYYLDTL